jgi:hypothetical protein
MPIKPAGRIAIVVIVVGTAFFIAKPYLFNKRLKPVETVPVVVDTFTTKPKDTVTYRPLPKQQVKAPTKVIVKPVVKPAPVEKKAPPKKKGERENLDINM